MYTSITGVKRVFVGLAVVAALAAAPTIASYPTITDAGSDYFTVRLNGSGFDAPDMGGGGEKCPEFCLPLPVEVEIYNAYDNTTITELVWMPPTKCLVTPLGVMFCYGVGEFAYTRDMSGHPCSDAAAVGQKLTRYARAHICNTLRGGGE